ncbi:MAG: hypothetical protein LBI67_10425 [Treponema sp.]|jgi:hypothetical protein|nr:hypothetical protein [Treponema sp.]
MKKLAILFLLTTLLVSFTFAQVTVKGGLDVADLNEANGSKITPTLYTEISGDAKVALGPGSIGAALQLGTGLVFEKSASSAYDLHGDNFLKGYYELPAGPGTLTIAVSTWFDTSSSWGFGNLHFNVGYAGIAAGPATLGLEAEYDLVTDGRNSSNEAAPFSDNGKLTDALDLKVTADFAFGLGIEYHFNYALADPDNFIAEIAKLNISYQVMDPLKVGAELTGTGSLDAAGDQVFFENIGLRPYAEYAINDKVTAGLEIPITHLNADGGDVGFSIGAWIKYAF